MYLVNWFQANVLMVLTIMVLIGIPVVIGIVVFSKKKDDKESKE